MPTTPTSPRPALRLLAAAALAAPFVLGAAGCGDDDGDTTAETTAPVDVPAETSDSTEPTDAPTTEEAEDDPEGSEDTYLVELSGAGEVPGPGDDDGEATLELAFDPSGEVCVTGEVDGLDAVTGAFIGNGSDDDPTTEAETRIDLGITTEGGDTEEVDTCTEADPGDLDLLLYELERNPDIYFVSLQTDEHPDGAVRGQIEAA